MYVQVHPHPVILLPTVEGSLLGNLLDFLYLGEVLLPSSESLEGFLQMVTYFGLESGVDVKESENEESRSSVKMETAAELGPEKIDQNIGTLLEPPSEAMMNVEETESDSEVKSDKKVYVQRSQAPSLKEKNLACNFCEYRIHRNDLLRVHMNSKHDVEKFKCAVASCSKVYSSKSNLKNHMKSWHNCSQCDHEAESNTDLKVHKRKVHNSSISYALN